VENENQLLQLKEQFRLNSVLNYTHEIGHNKLPFLDVNKEINSNQFITSVYTKQTNAGELLNFNSECPKKYKDGVILNMLNRAYKISSNNEIYLKEVDRLKQVFTNNNYPMKEIEECIEKHKRKLQNTEAPKQQITVYYENQMNEQYKEDEKIINDIIMKHVKLQLQHTISELQHTI